MADEQMPNHASPALQEFTDDAVLIPPEKRRRMKHLKPPGQQVSRIWILLALIMALGGLLVGFLVGRIW